MQRFLVVRIAQALVALLLLTLIVFSLSHLSGDPINAMLPDDATQAQIDRLVAHWGFDRPLHEQYFTFLGNALQGDFGESIQWRGQSALQVVLDRLPATLELGAVAVLISVLIGLPLGVLAAVHRGSGIDKGASTVALIGQSLPAFWLAIMLMWVFAVLLGLLPTSGRGSFAHIILPAISMAWFQIAALVRLTRSAMLEVLDAEYIKLARIKGLPEWKIVWKHALRNAALVPLTYFGVLAASILTGSIVIEVVFTWPGTGWLAIQAINARDFPVIQAVVITFAVIYIALNFLVDILYAYIDPRIRYE